MNELFVILLMAAAALTTLCIRWRRRLKLELARKNAPSINCSEAPTTATHNKQDEISLVTELVEPSLVQDSASSNPALTLEALWKAFRDDSWMWQWPSATRRSRLPGGPPLAVHLIESAFDIDGELRLRARVGSNALTCEEITLYLSLDAHGRVNCDGRCTCKEKNCAHQFVAWYDLRRDYNLLLAKRLLNKGETDKPVLFISA